MEIGRKEELLAIYENGNDEVFEEVLSLYEEALKNDPDNLVLRHRYGYIYEVKGRRFLERAASIYEEGVRQSIDNIKDMPIKNQMCHGQLIRVRQALGEAEKSVELYKAYIEKNPTNEALYIHLTNSYLKANQLEEAKVTIDAAYKLFTNSSLICYWKGEVYSTIGQVDEGITFLEKALDLDEDLIDTRFTLAYLLERKGRIDLAKIQWKAIINWLKDKGFNEECKYPERELKRLCNLK